MSEPIRVFVNGKGIELPAGATVRDAVGAADPELAAAAERGTAEVSDGRAIPIALDAKLSAGTILRVIRAARRSRDVPASEPNALP